MLGDGEVCEEGLHLCRPHSLRMAFIMKQTEPFNPLHIRVFCAQTVVAGTDHLSHVLQKPGRLIF